MRAERTPSTTLIRALSLARRTSARVQDLYNRPITPRPLLLVPAGQRSRPTQDTGREAA